MKNQLHHLMTFHHPKTKVLSFLFSSIVLLTFQMGKAQHCTPFFHFTADSYTVTFEDQSTADGTITSFTWDFGDGQTSTEQNPVITYAAEDTYAVCLTIVAHNPGCSATFCHDVVIHQSSGGTCHAGFNAHQSDPDLPIIDFTDQSDSDGTIGAWDWDFGDNNTSSEQNPSHTYAEPGTYLVCLTITDVEGGCTSHFCHEVTVHHPDPGMCHPAFVAHQSTPDLLTFDFTDQSTSDGTIGSWVWDFGDGTTSTDQNPSHTYPHAGAYVVCLTISDDTGCTNHVCHQIEVHHPPVGNCHAAFAAHQTDPALQTIDFTDQSSSDGTIGSWFWDFGDGNTSIEQNPAHTYATPGTFLVCLFITDADSVCTSHACHHVVVHHPPVNESNDVVIQEMASININSQSFTPSHPNDRSPLLQSLLRPVSSAQSSSMDALDYLFNYPNPCVSSTTLQYDLIKETDVDLQIFNAQGILIWHLHTDQESEGMHTHLFHTDDLTAGFYFIKMNVGRMLLTKMMTVVK